MMQRRDLLRAGAATGVLGLAGAGCGAHVEGFPMPSVADLLGLDMGGFLARLDSSLGFLRSSSSLEAIIPKAVSASALHETRFSSSEEVVRGGLRSLLLVGSFHDLPDLGRAHPGMQARLWNAMGELDSAMAASHRMLTSLTPTERADVGRALRDDRQLSGDVLSTLDAEAERAGVTDKRRAHLSQFSKRVMFRMRQSMNGLVDELDEKMQKVSARDWTVEDSERRLLTTIGEEAFWQEHARQNALAQAWRQVPGLAQVVPPPWPTGIATATPAAPPGTAPAAPTATGTLAPPRLPAPVIVVEELEEPPPPRGVWTLRAGGILFGMAALRITEGVILLATGSPIAILGAFDLTQGALQIVAGIVTLIVGGVQRSKSRKEEEERKQQGQ